MKKHPFDVEIEKGDCHVCGGKVLKKEMVSFECNEENLITLERWQVSCDTCGAPLYVEVLEMLDNEENGL